MIRRASLTLAICLTIQGQNQKYEIQQPKGKWQVPGPIQKPGEIQKVTAPCSSRLTVNSDALFAFDKADLGPQAEKILGDLGPMIKKEAKHPVSIEGNTDAIGSPSYNQELSERRARAVETWLVSHGYLADGAARVTGYGKTKPIAPNTNPDGSDNPGGRTKNRRVDVVIDTCR